MLDNLVRNAVRHSPPGAAVEIEAGLADRRVRIDVRDRGPGIPNGELDRMFEPFVRGSGTDGPGSGLGLSIARRIAELHGGTLTAANRPDGGCAFTILLDPRGAEPTANGGS
jgi:signal transduction histidine kinase